MDSKLPLVDGYWERISNIDHISSHSPGRTFACLATFNLALKLYGQAIYPPPPCDFHKSLYATLPTRLPPPQDGYITSTYLNTSASINSNPRTARTSARFFEFYPPRPCQGSIHGKCNHWVHPTGTHQCKVYSNRNLCVVCRGYKIFH